MNCRSLAPPFERMQLQRHWIQSTTDLPLLPDVASEAERIAPPQGTCQVAEAVAAAWLCRSLWEETCACEISAVWRCLKSEVVWWSIQQGCECFAFYEPSLWDASRDKFLVTHGKLIILPKARQCMCNLHIALTFSTRGLGSKVGQSGRQAASSPGTDVDDS